MVKCHDNPGFTAQVLGFRVYARRPDYFAALYERYASGVDLSKLTADDISRAAAAVGEPSLLLLGAAAAAAAVALAV